MADPPRIPSWLRHSVVLGFGRVPPGLAACRASGTLWSAETRAIVHNARTYFLGRLRSLRDGLMPPAFRMRTTPESDLVPAAAKFIRPARQVKSEVGIQKSEISNQKSEIGNRHGENP